MDRAREAPGVTLIGILLLMALLQGVFLVLLFLLLASNRAVATRRGGAARQADVVVAAPLNDWLAMGASVQGFADTLATLSERDAVAQMLRAAGRIPSERLEELAAAVRHAPWIERVLRRIGSRFWWRRLIAARVLAIVGTHEDRARLAALLIDENPAVQAVAATALPRVGDAALVASVVDALAEQPPLVRSAQQQVLLGMWPLAAPALLERLTADAATSRLRAWIGLADAFGTPELLARVRTLAAHPDPLVRISVAGALRKYFAPDALGVLRGLLADPDWRVRTRAAQSLGVVGAGEAIDDLARALEDENWWVRFRTALTLAQLGEPGRAVLRRARTEAGRPAADMAAMITGLSAGGLAEMSEG